MRISEAYFTPEEYITLERKAIPNAEIVRSEYMNGKIIGRSSSNWAHNLIAGNIVAELYTRLKSRECFVFANQMRVSIPSANSYFYPDVGVVCEEPRFEDDLFDILLNPIVVVEVLSPSTEAYDRGDKFAHYRQLQSLQEYVLVSQNKVRVDHYVRHTTQWILTDFQALEQHLPLTSIQCELPLQEIYENVPFPE
ncbi:Uma2 family endonuclease [Candidatus Poribacteria bacterium]|nr:Uma2 family endonuclease [Candidatus Poribacteria bacterium]MYH82897.1 Uma2 family endonuclease [Candidatus Poribacteria bacterium]MYK95062.1 Uma2 family endonuclease [Candidatus Poribacteria bacterium]